MATGLELSDLPWRKATASSVGNCVELAPHAGLVAVRDSKNPHGPVLMFTKSELVAWLDGARKGEFDDLAR
jgi:hypothetical protein